MVKTGEETGKPSDQDRTDPAPRADGPGTPDESPEEPYRKSGDVASWQEETNPKLRHKRTDYAKEVDGPGKMTTKEKRTPTAR